MPLVSGAFRFALHVLNGEQLVKKGCEHELGSGWRQVVRVLEQRHSICLYDIPLGGCIEELWLRVKNACPCRDEFGYDRCTVGAELVRWARTCTQRVDVVP